MPKRLAYLDGLRALAVLPVIIFHAQAHMPGVPLQHWAMECSHGVDLFFVLSGFCLAFPTFDALRSAGQVRFETARFALKRVLRIFPPYAVAVLVLAAAGAIGLAHGHPLPEGMHPYDGYDIVDELLFIDGDRQHINGSFWSLAVEFRWYFIFPLALALAARNVRTFVAALLLVAAAGELTRANSTDLGVMPAFLLGILAAAVRTNGGRLVRYAPLLMAASVVFALENELRPHFPIQTNVGWHAAWFFFLIFANEHKIVQRILSFPPLAAIGVASYSIYLVHEPIVSLTVATLHGPYGDLGSTLIALALGIAGGALLWVVVERPLTRPETVKAFVSRNEASMVRIFALAGLPSGFTMGSVSATLVAFPRPLTEAPPMEKDRPMIRLAPSLAAGAIAAALAFAVPALADGPAITTQTTDSGVQVIDMNPVPVKAAKKPSGGTHAPPAPAAAVGLTGADQLVHNAMAYVGVPFRMGGTTPAGFDCSGFTQFAYASIGVKIPRLADQQFYGGRLIAGDPLPGDLVFFQTYEYGPSHVGIYIGNGQFVNSIGRNVHVESFANDYFKSRYLGARRYL